MRLAAFSAQLMRMLTLRQDDAINDVILKYNHLVREFNQLFDVARQWQSFGEAKKQQIAQLRQDLANANQRALDAEAREADLRERYDSAEAYIKVIQKNAGRRESEINRLLIEIEHLKRR
jgi:chromosome segregation ATPase